MATVKVRQCIAAAKPMFGLADLEMARFLAAQLEAAATLESVARLFVHLEDRGLLCCREAICELAWMTDNQWLQTVCDAGVASPYCALAPERAV